MKTIQKMKIMNKTKLLLLALCAIALTGCGEQTQEQRDADMASRMTEFNYKGHQYIRYRSHYLDNAVGGITHDPDCSCHNKQSKQ